MTRLKNFLISIIVLLFLGTFIYSKINYSQVDREYVENLVDKRFVSVNNFDNGVILTPKDREGFIGYIFYPKNDEDVNSYIPIMSKLSERGFNVYIVESPLHKNFNTNKIGNKIINSNNGIKRWIISGESEGEISAKKFYIKLKERNDLYIKFHKYYKLEKNLKEL